MTTRWRIDLHLIGFFVVGLLLGALVLWLQPRLLVALLAMASFLWAWVFFGPRCPECGTNVHWLSGQDVEGFPLLNSRCAKCGADWTKV